MTIDIRLGDAIEVLRTIPSDTVQTCVTSPPYWGLRDYGVDGQLGLEKTPDEYVANMVAVFREVRRVLKPDGTLWINLGDSYSGAAGGCQGKNGERATRAFTPHVPEKRGVGLKPKDMVGIPWSVAFALRADGWWLRSEIIWHKPNCMPLSVRDRPTPNHETIFLLAKSSSYFYDQDAIREPQSRSSEKRIKAGYGDKYQQGLVDAKGYRGKYGGQSGPKYNPNGRNKRTVWTVTTSPFKGAHFATFPPKLVTPCVLAGSRPGDIVLDPFNGAGTTGLVATQLRRNYIGIEINPAYVEMTKMRLAEVQQDLFTRGTA